MFIAGGMGQTVRATTQWELPVRLNHRLLQE